VSPAPGRDLAELAHTINALTDTLRVFAEHWMETRELDSDAESAQCWLFEGRQLVEAIDQAVAMLGQGDTDQAVRMLRKAADRAREPFL
jgi:hypothetical protein